MNVYHQRAESVFSRIEELAAITETPGLITRTYGTPAFIAATKKLAQWMQLAGLQTRIDNIGNVRGKLLFDATAKTLVIASHLDSVVNAGRFDGPLGVLAGLDMIQHLVDTNTVLPFNIELIAFCDEEGVRFHTTYLGSRVVAGSFEESLLTKTDKDGVSLRQVITSLGGNVAQWQQDAFPKEDLLGYFEIHIEQGPVLYQRNTPVALVTAIAGQKRIELLFTGVSGHAGTVPMAMRKDALCCAAESVVAIESFATKHAAILATVGKLEVLNAVSNVIPGTVMGTLDLRSADASKLQEACSELQKTMGEICQRRSVQLDWKIVQESLPVICSADLNEVLKESIQAAGYPVVELVSGAGHDAVPLSAITPVSMLFVRCFEGISHHPLENVDIKDLAAALEVADRFISALSSALNQHEWKYPR